MKHYLSISLLIGLIAGCRCDDPILIDMGPIPDSILARVPYQDGKVYQFRHSAGKVISYAAHRASHEKYFDCERCCKYLYKYQGNTTVLVPDYPVFNLTFSISNPDSLRYDFFVWMGNSAFYPPVIPGESINANRYDSLLIHDSWHRDVFRIPNSNDSWFNRDSIYADTLYYNYQSGILKIVMSNGEYFQIHE